jgi:hypothetical protein
MAARTDIHRAGAFIPADYVPEFPFHLSHSCDGWPIPSWNVDLIVELRREGKVFAPVDHDSNATNVCSICGAWFIHGEVWRHETADEYITIGHTCAANNHHNAQTDDNKREKATVIAKAVRAAERRARKIEWIGEAREILAAHPGLGVALKTDHYIVRDIRERLIARGTISVKQIDLVVKLAAEALLPEEAKALVPVTDNRVVFEGEVVSTKYHEGYYGIKFVMTVLIDTGEGVYRIWGTVPAALDEAEGIERKRSDEAHSATVDALIEKLVAEGAKPDTIDTAIRALPVSDGDRLTGARVRFAATVAPRDSDESFGFFKRPTKAEVVSWPEKGEEA